MFEATFGREPLLGRLLQLRVAADYGAAPLGTATELRALPADAVAFVERCREHVGDEIAKGADDPDPTRDL